MLKIHRTEPSAALWARLEQFADRTIYQTPEWMRFVAETQQARPVWGEVRDGASVVGYLSGLVFSRFGIRVFGSPFPGWTTLYMGFNLEPEVPRWMALEALGPFAFRELGCMHFEIVDRYLRVEDGARPGVDHGFVDSQETDLKQSEEELFGKMESACRRCIRKAEKSGVTIEEAVPDGFAEEYYEQLEDVFQKQKLVPPYGVDRVRSLIENLYPTGRLLLVRARDPEGRSIGTGIYPGMNRIAQFWGNASFRWGQPLRPNETLHWYALRYWKRRGTEFFDWGGAADYKDKYGCYRIAVPRFYKSRFQVLTALRDGAQKIYRRKQHFDGWLRSLAGKR